MSVDSDPDVAVVQSVKSESPSEMETRCFDRFGVFGSVVLSKASPMSVTFLSNSLYSFSLRAIAAFSVVFPSPFLCWSKSVLDVLCSSDMLGLKKR